MSHLQSPLVLMLMFWKQTFHFDLNRFFDNHHCLSLITHLCLGTSMLNLPLHLVTHRELCCCCELYQRLLIVDLHHVTWSGDHDDMSCLAFNLPDLCILCSTFFVNSFIASQSSLVVFGLPWPRSLESVKPVRKHLFPFSQYVLVVL